MKMRGAFYALVVLTGLAAWPAAAEDPSDPAEVVREIYSFYENANAVGIWPTDPALRPRFSERLLELLDAEDELAEREGIGRLGFDPFIDGQDFAIDGLEISTKEGGGGTTVEARFTNFGEPTRIIYRFIRAEGRWQIDEIEAPDGPYPWRLSDILDDR